MSAVYNGQEMIGSIEADNGHDIFALDASGKRIGLFQTSVEAVSAVLNHARNPPPPPATPDAEAELATAIERFMKAKP